MKKVQGFAALLACLYCVPTCLASAVASTSGAGATLTAADGSVTATIGSTGITSLKHNGEGMTVSLSHGARTELSSDMTFASASCKTAGTAKVTDLQPGQKAVAVSQPWSCSVASSTVTATVVDTFSAAAKSIAVNTTITTDKAVPFTARLNTALEFASLRANSSFWLPFGKGCVQNNGRAPGMCLAGGGPWSSALAPEILPAGAGAALNYRYGGTGHGVADMFSVPVATVLPAEARSAFSLALDPGDPILELALTVDATGVEFGRELLRIGGLPVTFSAHVIAHASCWRPGLQFATTQFPSFFLPWVEHASEFEGLGSYSWNQQPYNATRAKAIGFKTNWDLSGTWMPYDGLFLPYMEEWPNLGPINGGLAQYNVTYQKMEQYYEQIQSAGFHSLSYFDIGNWGTQTDVSYKGPKQYCGSRPNGKGGPCPGPNGGNAYLRDELSTALLTHGWSVGGGFFNKEKHDWVGTTDMDTMEPCFEDLIVEQCARHISKLKSFEGIAIDRLDYSEFFNFDADDNISWVPYPGDTSEVGGDRSSSSWGKARALRLSYRHTFNRLHDALHTAQPAGKKRMILNNCNTVCRLDQMRAFDGTFSEGAALNAVAWTGIRNPTILWTYNLAGDVNVLDDFFQQHLLMNVYPMAPMPLNDHSIQPGDPVVEQAYHDYGPLFDAMHGARWLLSSNPVAITIASATAMETFVHDSSPIQNPVSLQPCKPGDPSQEWSVASDATDEIKLAGDNHCLGLWCCGCKTCCGPACTAPDESAQVASNACHPQDKNPAHWNQEWAVGTGGFVTEKKSGKSLVAASAKAGSAVEVVSSASMPPSKQHRLVHNGSAITLPGSAPSLCLSANPPAAGPPPPTTPEVNVFTLPAGGANENPPATTPPALLIPIMLAGSHQSAMLTLNLARTYRTTLEMSFVPVRLLLL